VKFSTIYAKIDSERPENNACDFERAAEIIKNGGLVAFPTETVYGLGANALSEAAVKKIYAAKGRPSDNPLIAHIAEIEALSSITESISGDALRLADAFWPGPLTLIFKKKAVIPGITSGGLNTIAVRLPSCKAAAFFIKACGLPIAAPSANISGKPSPTEASHVLEDMDGKIDMIIDGGPCEIGLESTIVDVSGVSPCILRPGGVTREMIEAALGAGVELSEGVADKTDKPRSPGQKYRHYAPDCGVVIVSGGALEAAAKINAFISEKINNSGKKDIKIGVAATDETLDLYDKRAVVISLGSRSYLPGIASRLFGALRGFDAAGCEIAYFEAFDRSGIGLAIMNRLCKAAGNNVINI
jgi:L-threonylcarbamoyladenylate synthase